MADLSTVVSAIADKVSLAVYPTGPLNPSVAGVDVTIFAGWPIRNDLDDVLNAGNAMVSVFPTNKERVVTKFPRQWQQISVLTPTLTATVLDNTVTIGGTVSVPQAVMIIVDGRSPGYAYQVLITDTVDTIAASLAAMIPGATALGAVITIPNPVSIIARIAAQALAGLDLGRQDRVIMISVWSPSPTIRSLLAPPIDEYLRVNYQFQLNDGFYCMLFYDHTVETDQLELQEIYRRDLNFRVQYSTTYVQPFTTITDPYGVLSVG